MHYVKVKGILSAQNGMNLYRGCSHGCIYCDSRSACYHMTHPFEDIEVKENAIALLEEALRRRRRPCMIGTGSMTDPYIPLETQLGATRKALLLLERYGFGATLITKSDRVLRDLALLQSINERTKCVVQMTLTTHDEALCRLLEPHVCATGQRVAALEALRGAGVPTVVWLSPILPLINDTPANIEGILAACAQAGVYGVICFGMGVTLREGSREYFYAALDRLFPGLRAEYVRRYGMRYALNSPDHDPLMRLFHQRCEQYGLVHDNDALFAFLRAFEEKKRPVQLSLFD